MLDCHSSISKNAIKIFKELDRKAKELDRVRCDPRINEHDAAPNFEQLNRDAVKSLNILPEVQKTDEGFEGT